MLATLPVDDIEKELNKDVRKRILEGIVGFGPPGESIQSALDMAIERLEAPPDDDQEPILNALKIGLEAVLALLKPGEDGSYQPTASEQEAVTNLYKAVSSNPPGKGQEKLSQTFAPAGTVVLITPPSGSVRPKVYLP